MTNDAFISDDAAAPRCALVTPVDGVDEFDDAELFDEASVVGTVVVVGTYGAGYAVIITKILIFLN